MPESLQQHFLQQYLRPLYLPIVDLLQLLLDIATLTTALETSSTIPLHTTSSLTADVKL